MSIKTFFNHRITYKLFKESIIKNLIRKLADLNLPENVYKFPISSKIFKKFVSRSTVLMGNQHFKFMTSRFLCAKRPVPEQRV